MKIVFFGTGEFAVPILKKLVESSHIVSLVVTRPDKKKGRGWNVEPTCVKALITQVAPQVNVLQPENTQENGFLDFLITQNADLFVVVDYGEILGSQLINIPKKYCINVHPSLLPKYRGAAPINWAILNGENETGNTIIRMTDKMDAGDIILQEALKIEVSEDALSLSNRLSNSAAKMLLEALDLIEKGKEHFIKQDERAATYAPKLEKKQGEIDWTKSAIQIDLMIRGLKPWPSAFTYLDGKMLKIIKAEIYETIDEEASTTIGTIYDAKNFIVKTGKKAIRVKELQLEGKKIMEAHEFVHGYNLTNGMILGTKKH